MINKGLKKRIIEISYPRKLSHLGSALTAIDIIKEIYDLKKSNEKFILSSGHAHIAHAVMMESLGLIKDAGENIDKYGIHCEQAGGCDVSTGSLGQGFPISCGLALADRSRQVYVLCSDGELAEGSCFEAMNVMREQQINNLYIYINNNGFSAYRETFVQDFFGDNSQVEVRKTDVDDFPFLKGIDAHYYIMTKEDYELAQNLCR